MELRDLSSAYPQYQFVFASREELPLDNFEKLAEFFRNEAPDFCINCAAYTQVDAAESHAEEAFKVNAEAVYIIADLCRDYETRLIHISTDYVFDGEAKSPYKEDAPTNPVGVYGESKLEGEKVAIETHADTIIIRTSWVYSSYGKNFVKTMMKLMDTKDEINVVNDQVGSPTYAADLAEVVMEIIGGVSGIYHFTNEGVTTWYEFAIAIKDITGSNCQINPIPTELYPTPAKRPLYSVLDKSKIQHTFSIRLKDWRQSLMACIAKIKRDNL